MSRQADKADKPLKGLNILVVDDAPIIVKMVVRMLTAAGAVVDFAKDGGEGVDMYCTWPQRLHSIL